MTYNYVVFFTKEYNMFRYATLFAVAILASPSNALNIGLGSPHRATRIARSSSSFRRQAVAIPLVDPAPGTILDIPQPTAAKNEEEETKNQRKLDPADAWIANLDYEGFGREVTALGKELLQNTGDADVEHLQKIVGWRNIAAIIGLSTVWMTPNPVTVVALSTWVYASWTMIAHHTCHGGYNRVDAGRFNSRRFALGVVNRCVDWLDWMQPEAWNVEHNRLHHYRLNEVKDPDLVQRNLESIQSLKMPMFVKYAAVGVVMTLWKWWYYAPNTYKELKLANWVNEGKKIPEGIDVEQALTLTGFFNPKQWELFSIVKPLPFWTTVMGPMLFGRYVLIPGLFYAIPGVGPTLALHALTNLVLAEILTNLHSFATIVTNHAGEDIYSFDDAVKPKTGSFYVRQIVGSVNYRTGNDVNDFAHGWLNYQIEHHVWPDLSMLQYQKGAPKLKAICQKYGVPYVQENVFERVRKTVDIMVGKTTMREFPTDFEPTKDKAGRTGVTWKSTNGAIDDE